MNKTIFLLALSSIFLSSLAQVILKLGMSQPDVLSAISNSSVNNNAVWSIFRAISTNFYVIAGLGLYFSSAAVWLFVLAKVDVSTAYPFVGMGFIITMMLAYFINHEALSVLKITGTLMITAGIILISKA